MGLFTRSAKGEGSSASEQEQQVAMKLARAYKRIFFGMDRKSVEREAAKDLCMRPIRFGNGICGYDLTFAGKPFSMGMKYHQDRLYAIDFDYYGPDPYDVRDALKSMMESMYGHLYAASGEVIAWKADDRLARLSLNRGRKSVTSVRLYIEYTPMVELIEQEKAEKSEQAIKSEISNFC